MVQTARPDSDLLNQGYVNQVGSSSSLFQAIDEAVASDADYIISPTPPLAAVYACGLSNVTDPVASTGHVIRYRYRKSASGGARVDYVIQLRQGYVSESNQGTLIASAIHADIPAVATTSTLTLSAAEANAITDYNALGFRAVFNQP
jgi:hypothetical protein